jgi:hypothetical protein
VCSPVRVILCVMVVLCVYRTVMGLCLTLCIGTVCVCVGLDVYVQVEVLQHVQASVVQVLLCFNDQPYHSCGYLYVGLCGRL